MTHYTVLVVGEDVEGQLAPFNEELEIEQVTDDGETYWRNPRARWDWWVVGGRWSQWLLTTDGRAVDRARKGEINWEAMLRRSVQWAEQAWARFQGDDGPAAAYLNGVREGETREECVRRRTKVDTTAILKDGEWHENGKTGWFATSHGETMTEEEWTKEWENIVQSLPPDALLTLVDCHI